MPIHEKKGTQMKNILFTAVLTVLLSLFSYHADAQTLKLYLAGTAFNSDLSFSPPNNGYVTNFEAVNSNYVKTFDNLFLANDIVGTSYTFAIRCRSNAAGGRIFSAKIQIGGQEVASTSWNVSNSTMTLYTNTVTGIDPTITTSTEVKLIVTINGTSGATSAISLGDSSQSTPLYSYIEIPPIISTGVEEARQAVAGFALEQNFPNPFNPSTTIRFSLAIASFASLRVFDITGQEIATLLNKEMSPGIYEVTWNASGMQSGVYIVRLQAGSLSETKKLILLR